MPGGGGPVSRLAAFLGFCAASCTPAARSSPIAAPRPPCTRPHRPRPTHLAPAPTDSAPPTLHPPPPTPPRPPRTRPVFLEMSTRPRELLKDPLHWLALGGGSGLLPRLPGTAGTLVAALLYWLLLRDLPLAAYAAVVCATLVAGVYLCGRTARALGREDPPQVVWDEFSGYWITMFALPPDWPWVLGGLLLFRLFDICKPWPMRRLERLGGGLGIMLDDVVAGLFSCALLHIAWHLVAA